MITILWKRLLSLTLAAGLLVGGPSGCVTATLFEAVFELEDDDAVEEVSSSGMQFMGRLGLAGLLLPFTLSADVAIGWLWCLLAAEGDGDDDDGAWREHKRNQKPRRRDPPRRHPLTPPPPAPTGCAGPR